MSTLKYFSCILLLFISQRNYSQIPDTVWTKTFGGPLSDVGYSVKQTSDGGFIVAATTTSFGAGGQDIYLIKTDENGDTLWTKSFGGTGNDRAANVVQTNDNGYAIFGTTNSFGNGGDDFLILKTDSFGNNEWFKTFGGINNDVAYDGQQLSDSNYVIVGDTIGQNVKARLIKTDKYGNFIWARTIGTDSYGVSLRGRSVQQTNDGRYAVSGIHSFLAFYPDYVHDYFLSIVSSTGNSHSTHYYGALNFQGVWGVQVKKLSDGNLILGGSKRNLYGGGAEEPWIIKTSQIGNAIWANVVLGSQYPAVLTSIGPTNDNGFIFTIYGPNISLLKCDENGILTWEKIVGGPLYDEAYSISQIDDGGYIVTGYTKSFGAGNSDVWLLKFKYSPPDVEIDFFPPVDTALINGGCCTPQITAKNLSSTLDRDSISIEPGPTTTFYYLDSTGTPVIIDNYYFVVIDSLDEFEYELRYNPKANDSFDPIIIPFDSSFYTDNNKFDIQLIVKKNGLIVDSLSQPFHADFGLDVKDSLNSFLPNNYKLFQNYPNPFNPNTVISYQLPVSSIVTLKVYDVLGNEVAKLVNEEKQPGKYEVEFSPETRIKHPASGIYFYQLKADNFVETKKMILLK